MCPVYMKKVEIQSQQPLRAAIISVCSQEPIAGQTPKNGDIRILKIRSFLHYSETI